MTHALDFDRERRLALPEGGVVRFSLRQLAVEPGTQVVLGRDFDPAFSGALTDKESAREYVAHNVGRLAALQEKLYAQGTHAVLLVLQGIDSSGKDGTVRHVLSGVNPQGCRVSSFKAPSSEELAHDYLWRVSRALPARGMIGIFNRSHYEEVLVVRVHPEFLAHQRLPGDDDGAGPWRRRFREINDFERYLVDNGISIVKVFLNISKEEQRKRLLARLDDPNKQWKFSEADLRERERWDDYQHAYSSMLTHTSTEAAPWFVIPANRKWFARLAVSEILCTHLEALCPEFPAPSVEQLDGLAAARATLEKDVST